MEGGRGKLIVKRKGEGERKRDEDRNMTGREQSSW